VRIEKTVTVKAPLQRAWEVLLDPAAVAACVPGVERIEPVDATHFVVTVNVKVGIVRARFKIHVAVTETRPPHYLRSEGRGEEAGLTSSLRQSTELELKELGPSETELRVATDVEVFGALGTFGYSVMKGKADRMWEEFAANLQTRIE
jgi:carbon monoxide dehydrogenase subunit G